jgi:hypothetical protein
MKNSSIKKEYYLMGYNAVYFVESQPAFQRNISPSSSGTNKPSKILPAFMLVSCSGYLTLKMEAMFLQNAG